MEILAWLIGSKVGRYVALGLLIAASIGVVLLRVYSAGKSAEKARQAEAALRALRERIKTDDEITKLSPTARRERLSRWVSDDL